ncbi:MAG: redoxin domain-containing protein [Rikenellaceae bacterium]|jgi:thiol-disulfide isomerase/thioredoxin|nr:redoxin domain-containing protein [Rikenellaceae bacterium]
MKIRLLPLLFSAGLLISPALRAEKNEGIVFLENQPWETVLARAKEQNRLIFMDCYTTWCGPCKGLAQNIFPQKKVGDFFNANFVNVSYDMEKGDGIMLNKKYKEYIIGYPTLLLIDHTGKALHQMAGYQEADALIEGMRGAMGGLTLEATEAKFNAGARDFRSVKDYVTALNGAFKKERIPEVVEAYLATVPVETLSEAPVWELCGRHITDPYTPQYKYVVENVERVYQRKLKVDRYELETQLYRSMSRAASELLAATRKTANPDTLRMIREKSAYLLGIASSQPVKGFPSVAAKLYVNTLRLDGKPMEVNAATSMFNAAGTLGDKGFVSESYRYILENTKDKKVVKPLFDALTAMQASEDRGTLPALSGNYRDMIALACDRLGDRAGAAENRREYLRLEEEKKAYWQQMFGKREKKGSQVAYRIDGTWPGGDGQRVYLSRVAGKNGRETLYENLDSTVVADGRFAFAGTGEIETRTLRAAGQKQELILTDEPLEATVTNVERVVKDGSRKNFITLDIKGGHEQSVLEEANKRQSALSFMKTGLMFMMVQAKDDAHKVDSLYKVMVRLEEEQNAEIRQFIEANIDSHAITYIIGNFIARYYPIEEVERYYGMLTERIKESYPGRQLAAKLATLKSVNVGGMAPEIKLPTPDGTLASLSSLRGKYVLLDFWASWCGPCLRETPNVKEVYAAWHSRGFEVFGVSLDEEKQREAWLAAIKKHEMPWTQVSSLKGWDCPAAKLYNVTGIPKTFLIDPQGKIIAVDLRGEELKEKIASLFK